jgi:protein tyrosine phosphatase (PTP) superfamily phosphohydrolase (DUF442 family)
MARARFAWLLMVTCATAYAQQPADEALPKKLSSKHLPNLVQVHAKVISGGLPQDEAAFKELEALGIKTVISVDGAKPDVALAKKHGMRYVHLPHGYDGIPDDRAAELAKAVRDLPGPVYVHCHHGQHRSPAAAAVACVEAGLIPAEQSLPVLKIAGTSPSYRGLYDSAKQARPLGTKYLDDLKAEFPSTAKLPAMAEAMVQIEHAHDHLQALAANRWQKLPEQPALDTAHEALLLREHFTELLRSDEVRKEPAKYVEMMQASETTARALEVSLEAWTKAGRPPEVPAIVAASLARVTKSCTDCHAAYRNVPLKEKGGIR